MKGIQIKHWGIVSFVAIAIGMLLVTIFIIYGFSESTIRLAIRLTARTSCLLFLLAFLASTLHYFWHNQISHWLKVNRRYVGLSMAVSHSYHALAIIGLAILAPDPYYYNNHGGNLGYLFIFLMTVTSFERTSNLLGNRTWKIIHTVGMYYLWLAFTVTFTDRLSESFFIYFPFVSLLIGSLLARLLALFHNKSVANNH